MHIDAGSLACLCRCIVYTVRAPRDWAQFDPYQSNSSGIPQVFLNAGNAVVPDWRSAIFDLEQFIKNKGNTRLVHIKDHENELQRVPLLQWVKSEKPQLRGNTRGVLYYDKDDGWNRLNDLLPALKEVRATHRLVLLSGDLLVSAGHVSLESSIYKQICFASVVVPSLA